MHSFRILPTSGILEEKEKVATCKHQIVDTSGRRAEMFLLCCKNVRRQGGPP